VSCISCYNGACPEVIPEVNITQTILRLAEGDAEVTTETFLAVTGTGVTLSAVPLSGFAVGAWVNGVMQPPEAFSVAGAVVTFTFALDEDDVVVWYAHEV
jgi:hypothetical protein